MSELYDADLLAWSERQAALLRRVAAGERVADNDMDWPNIIEEIESVGQSQVDAVESLIIRAFLHMLKAQAWPQLRRGELPGRPRWGAGVHPTLLATDGK